MAEELHHLYVSSNGDLWSLGHEIESGRLYILHEANEASGGTRTELSVEDFLKRDVGSPQHQKLMELLQAVRNKAPP